MARRQRVWGIDPESGGIKIPDKIKPDVEARIQKYAEENFSGRYTRLDIRFNGKFCYIDAYTEPEIFPNWPPPDWPESKEEYIERMRDTPTHLCRLRYFGYDSWGFAFYTYSNERYELSVFSDGKFFGTIEEAFHLSAEAYLHS